MTLQEQLDELKRLLEDETVLLSGSGRFQNRTFSLADLVRLRDQTQTRFNEEQKRSREASQTARDKANVERVSAATQAERKKVDVGVALGVLNRTKADLNIAISRGGDVVKAQADYAAAVQNLRAIDPRNPNLPTVPVLQVSPSTVSGPVAAPPGARSGARPQTPVVSPTGGAQNVPTQTAAPIVVPTPSGGAGATAGGSPASVKKPRKPKQQVDPDAWRQALQQFFPSYSSDWLDVNAVTHFGKDLVDLMVKVSDPKSGYDLTTSEGLDRIRQEIRGTAYWKGTVQSAKNFDQLVDADRSLLVSNTKQRIANTYGDVGLDEATLEQVALNVARQGLTGLGEKQAVYNAVFTARQSAPQQAGRALQGADADRIRQLGRAYNFNVSDNQIQSILTGTPEASSGVVLTEAGLRERLQRYVKGIMPQLSDQIDAGLTLEDIGGNYRRYAASLLEQSEDQIDMFEGPFVEAFGNKEQGQLSLGEWTQKVKSDSRFGWQYTNQANQQATDVALTLARAFGKVG